MALSVIALDLVEPRPVSGNEMRVPARTLGKPDFHPRVLRDAPGAPMPHATLG